MIVLFILFLILDIDANDQNSGLEVEDEGVVENARKPPTYNNETESSMAPKFTKLDKMHRVVAKPAGNMLKLKCVAEGELKFYGLS